MPPLAINQRLPIIRWLLVFSALREEGFTCYEISRHLTMVGVLVATGRLNQACEIMRHRRRSNIQATINVRLCS